MNSPIFRRSAVLVAMPFLLASTTGWAQPASSQTKTDATAVANQLLASLGPQSVTTTTTTQVDGPQICRPIFGAGGPDGPHGFGPTIIGTQCSPGPKQNVQARTITQAILTAQNVRITTDDIAWETPVISSIPADAIADSRRIKNCSSTPQSFTVSMSFQTQQSAQISLSHTVTNTRSQSVGVSAGFAGIGVSGSMGFGSSDGTTNAQVTGNSNGQTQTLQEPIIVPANAVVIAQLITSKTSVTVPFTMNALIDADISSNNKGYATLAQLFSADQRRTQVAGVLLINNVSNGDVTFYQQTPTPGMCTAGLVGGATPYAPIPTDRLIPLAPQSVAAGVLTRAP